MRTRWRSANIASCCARATATICACFRAASRSCRSRCRCAGSTTCSATASRSRPSTSAPKPCRSSSTATVEHNPAEEFALTADDPAYFYPFLYDDEEFPDLVQFITPQYGDPDGELSAWARNFLDAEGPTPTFKILSNMTYGIREAFTYRKRHEHGTQHPLDTLQTRSGTCRDYALFMIEALRRLGIAARFVSGYLFIPGDRAHGYVGGGSTHAWVQVYLPSAGWIEFDPTNGIVGTRDLVRVAVARDPAPGDPAARHLSRLGRCVCRHGRQHQRRFGRRSERAAEALDMEIKVGFEITYAAAAADADGDHALAFIPRAIPTSSAPRPSSPSRTCRSASTATALAMSAAGWWRPPAA